MYKSLSLWEHSHLLKRITVCNSTFVQSFFGGTMNRPHHDLDVWKLALDVVDDTYALTRQFPKEELFGLVAHSRKSAISVVSNIAEGAARVYKSEFAQFLSYSRGSLSELETQLIISKRQGFLENDDEVQEKIDRVFAMLNGLIRKQR
jgi:four helix bundle protein